MEDVLALYARQPSEGTARICFDERPCQLVGDLLTPLPMQPGQPERQDYEYIRRGTAAILLAYDIDSGQRYTQVRQRRTKEEYARFMDWLVEQHYPDVAQIHLVQDNLNTHHYGSFYEHLPACRARTLAEKIKFHFTPKHGSWLNMAEIEFSALARGCLDKRIDSLERLEKEVLQWSESRNSQAIKIHWSFTVNAARQKLASHYTRINEMNSEYKN